MTQLIVLQSTSIQLLEIGISSIDAVKLKKKKERKKMISMTVIQLYHRTAIVWKKEEKI